MNGKRLLILAAFAALATVAMPSAFASTVTNTITVKWNTQILSSITMVTQYSAAGAQGNAVPTITSNLNGGAGICTAGGGGAEANLTANFGNVTPDSTKFTDCMYPNGVNAAVVSSDANGYNVAEKATAGYVTGSGYLLCLLPNGVYANNLAVTQSARAGVVPSIVSTAVCPGGDFLMDTTGATILPNTGAGGTTALTNLGGDIELVLGPNAPSGAITATITYTLTNN